MNPDKKDIRTFSKGAVSDLSREIIGSENKGIYLDSLNGRISSDRGNKGDWEKIRGEVLTWKTTKSGTWHNLLATDINGDIFEIWVTINGLTAPFIKINGVIMAESPDLPFDYNHPVQYDKNESCVGGEILMTDNYHAPLIFNIKDIKDNYAANTGKYFANFNIDLYSANLSSPLDIPIFTGLTNVGGGGGLPVGSYQYAIRYVNDDGDRTNFGPMTPAIPVPENVSSNTSRYPWIKTVGGVSNSAVKTTYGINLRFRITNESNYSYIEIKRIAYNNSQGIDSVPPGVIIAKIDISPGEISVRDFVDPIDANLDLVLSDEDEYGTVFSISRAKAVRYHDKRMVLMNIGTTSKDANVTLKQFAGKKIFPIVDKLGKEGFSDPVNHTYKKNFMSGEKHSFAIALFDSVAGRTFAIEDAALKNVQAPNRRDRMSTESKNFSYKGVPTAAASDFSVGEVFESFDHVDAVAKDNINGFYNILNSNRDKSASQVYQYGRTDQGEGYGSQIKCDELGYRPITPTDNSDGFVGHNFIVNPKVNAGSSDIGASLNYRPKGFGLNYYTKGYAIGGLDNIPSWAKSFSILRSDRAGRVVCQGIGMYALEKGDFGLITNKYSASKKANKIWFHSPDAVSGIVSYAELENIKSNPQAYKVQFVSPLGFFSEVYSFEQNTVFGNRDYLIDMVAYARVIRDNGEINVGEDTSMGQAGPDGRRYVAYSKYRNNFSGVGQGVFNTVNKGNQTVTIKDFKVKVEGRNTFYEIELANNIYQNQYTGGNGENHFGDQGMKSFTEPFYMVNIIKEGAVVQDLDTNQYYSTGHYQKVKSLIGLGDGELNQEFILVDERWEDCIPSLTLGGYDFGGERFIYLDNNGIVRPFFNVTYKTTPEKQTIASAINTNGFFITPEGKKIYGMYTHKVVGNDKYIVFDYAGTVPADGEKIYVNYDNRIPIRFFGGDTVAAENIFAPIDKEADATDSKDDKMFGWNIGFPYKEWKLNPGIFIAKDAGATFDLQTADNINLGYLRQLCLVYTCESITSSNYNINQNGVKEYQFFPATNYVLRPNRFDSGSFGSSDEGAIASDNKIYPAYFSDYPGEHSIWKYGGVRFTPNRNHDYHPKGPKDYFSKPKFGYVEKNDFCTGIAWSLPRATNQQDSPGLKTFLSSNFYELNDDAGEIKKAWDSKSDGTGTNLYAITQKGIALLLTKKSILSNINGDDLAVTSADSFISNEYWISTRIGSPGEMWRAMAEASVEIEGEGGSVEIDTLFIPTNHSVYMFSDNIIRDILKNKYRSRMLPYLQGVLSGFSSEITGHFDKNHNEYWIELPGDIMTERSARKLFVFDVNERSWIGRFTYKFNKYMFLKSKNYGFKNQAMYELDKGYQIDGNAIRAEIRGFSAPEIGVEKEFIDIEVMTGPRGEMKPSFIHFYDEKESIQCTLSEPNFGPLYLKQYDGWKGQVPRKQIGVSAKRERVQLRLLIFDIVHTLEEDFKVSQVHLKYKPIK